MSETLIELDIFKVALSIICNIPLETIAFDDMASPLMSSCIKKKKKKNLVYKYFIKKKRLSK